MASPYANVPILEWSAVTERLVTESPLSLTEIRELALESWQELWQTKIGVGSSAIPLTEIEIPSPVVGYFFERLFIRNLIRRQPDKWRGGKEKGDKDIVYLADERYSIELKTSGQMGTKIFGNRSHGQQTTDPSRSQKEKSGYYITINFFGLSLNLIRFGWIDHSDWKPQKSATGQMAGLTREVYLYKLLPIRGAYQLLSPVWLLEGIGKATAQKLSLLGVQTIEDLQQLQSSDPKILLLQQRAKAFLGE